MLLIFSDKPSKNQTSEGECQSSSMSEARLIVCVTPLVTHRYWVILLWPVSNTSSMCQNRMCQERGISFSVSQLGIAWSICGSCCIPATVSTDIFYTLFLWKCFINHLETWWLVEKYDLKSVNFRIGISWVFWWSRVWLVGIPTFQHTECFKSNSKSVMLLVFSSFTGDL